MDKSRIIESLIQVVALSVTILLVGGALFFLFFGSFWSSRPGTPGFFTLNNYIRVSETAWFSETLWNSIWVSCLTVVIACCFGIPLAWIVARTNVPFADKFDQLSIFPFLVPPFVLAIAWALMGDPIIGLVNRVAGEIFPFISPIMNIYTPFGVAWVAGLFYTPYIFLFVSGALKSMDPSLEDAARVSGSGTLNTLIRVTLPLITPAIISSIFFVFVLGIEMFSIPMVLGYPSGLYTLIIRIYMLFRWPPVDNGLAYALSVFLLAICLIGTFLYRRFSLKKPFITVTGKGYRPRRIDLGRWKYAAFSFCVIYLLVAVVIPYILIALTSFLTIVNNFDTWSLRNWQYIFSYPLLWRALQNSIITAALTAIICILLAMVVSWVAYRTKVRGRSIPEYFASLPISVPGIVMAAGILGFNLFVFRSLYGTIFILVIAYIIRFIPYGVRTTSNTIVQIHPELEEAARASGASWLTTFSRITFPLFKPGILSGLIFLLVVCFRELPVVTLLWTSQSITLPVLMFEIWTEGRWGWVAALSLIQSLVIFSIIAFCRKVLRWEVRVRGE